MTRRWLRSSLHARLSFSSHIRDTDRVLDFGFGAGRFDWTVDAKNDAGSLPCHATMMIVLMYLVPQSYGAGFMKLVYVGVPVGVCLKLSKNKGNPYSLLTGRVRADSRLLAYRRRAVRQVSAR